MGVPPNHPCFNRIIQFPKTIHFGYPHDMRQISNVLSMINNIQTHFFAWSCMFLVFLKWYVARSITPNWRLRVAGSLLHGFHGGLGSIHSVHRLGAALRHGQMGSSSWGTQKRHGVFGNGKVPSFEMDDD